MKDMSVFEISIQFNFSVKVVIQTGDYVNLQIIHTNSLSPTKAATRVNRHRCTDMDRCSLALKLQLFACMNQYTNQVHCRLGVKYFEKYLNANTSKFFKCKCEYFYFLQMQILFKSISNNFSNTFKYFDRYAILIRNRNNNKKK